MPRAVTSQVPCPPPKHTARERRSEMVANLLLADAMLGLLSMQQFPTLDDVKFWRFVRDEADDALKRGAWQ